MDIKQLSSDFPICAPIDFKDVSQLESSGVQSIVCSRSNSEVDLVSMQRHYVSIAPCYLSRARSHAVFRLANL